MIFPAFFLIKSHCILMLVAKKAQALAAFQVTEPPNQDSGGGGIAIPGKSLT